MSEEIICPNCQSPYGYPNGMLMMCPECGHEWNPEEESENAQESIVKDVNRNPLQDGIR